MSLTIEQLTRIPYLRTWIHAGASGSSNLVAWAHSIELPRPWEWLEGGDLLMTVGLGIPADTELQVEYVHQLAKIGASGVAIGADMQAPPLSKPMLQAADKCGLPLCFTAYEVPFIQLSRAVAAASQRTEYARIVGVARIYEQARAAVARKASASELLNELQEEVRCDLYALENRGGTLLFAGSPEPDRRLISDIGHALASRETPQLGLMRMQTGDREVLVVPIPARRGASLIAVPRGDAAPAFVVLQHVATLAALEIERLWALREEQRRLGGELLAHLLAARISPALAMAQISSHGFTEEAYRVVAASRLDGHSRDDQLHHALADRDLAHLLLRSEDLLYALVSDRQPAVETIASLLDADVRLGVSSSFGELDGIRAAVGEARWALESGRLENVRLTRYGDHAPLFAPRSIPEARAIVTRVLGPLLSYDEEHDTQLLTSLRAFLNCNRSWQRAAAELYVHKQTLIYRMRRVEQLTSRKLNNTADVSELWLTLQAQKLLE